jgi:glycosyltransferase involved in cell wall biosynthesis
VLALGQTPPPFGGQAIGFESFVKGRYEGLRVVHVRMAFSAEMDEVGKVRAKKILHLAKLAAQVLWQRLRTGADILYFPPAGPEIVPVVRDLLLLSSVRWAFPYTAFHFHAAGLSEYIPRLPRFVRRWCWHVYGRPDLAIMTSALNPRDDRFLRARRTVVVHPGSPDTWAGRPAEADVKHRPIVLYVGVLKRSKGLLVLAEACGELVRRGVDFEVHLMGGADSKEFERELAAAFADAGMDGRAVFLGTRSGAE